MTMPRVRARGLRVTRAGILRLHYQRKRPLGADPFAMEALDACGPT